MGFTPEQQHPIIEQESAWTDSSFGGIDLSAYPALSAIPLRFLLRSRKDGLHADASASGILRALLCGAAADDRATAASLGGLSAK